MTSIRMNNGDLIVDLRRLNAWLSDDTVSTFLRNFKTWESKRKGSVETLKKLHQAMMETKSNTDIARGVAIGVSVLGGLATIVGCVLSLNESTRETGEKMMKGGAATGLVGGGTALAASGINCIMTDQQVNEAKKILNADERMTQQLLPFFKRSEETEKLINKIFGSSVLSDTMADFIEAIEIIKVISRKGENVYSYVSDLIKGNVQHTLTEITCMDFDLQKLEKKLNNLGSKVKLVLEEFCNDPRVREEILKFHALVKKSPILIDSLKFIMHTQLLLSQMLSSSAFLSLLSSVVAVGPAITASNILIPIILLGINFVTFLSSIKDFNKKESKYSQMIKNLISLLEKEMRCLSDLYKRLNNNLC